jgi:hypothetical protein
MPAGRVERRQGEKLDDKRACAGDSPQGAEEVHVLVYRSA